MSDANSQSDLSLTSIYRAETSSNACHADLGAPNMIDLRTPASNPALCFTCGRFSNYFRFFRMVSLDIKIIVAPTGLRPSFWPV